MAMPKAAIRRRGGTVRVRTIEGPTPGTYRRVYIVRKAGEKGGHTIVGEIQHKQTGARSGDHGKK
jgi:hypothetical protein